MSSLEKTIKMRAFTPEAPKQNEPGNVSEDKKLSLELVNKTYQLEEEKNKTLENLKVIGQLRESLKQEQGRSAGLAARVAELEAAQANSLESSKKIAERETRLAEQQARIVGLEEKLLVQETKTKALQAALNQISVLAASAK